MEPTPDSRWEIISGGVNAAGEHRPMSFDVLAGLSKEWGEITAHLDERRGPVALLRMARSLFVHAWFDYEFMAVACLVSFQAMEAAFRELYPTGGKPLRALVRRAREERHLPPAIADLADTGVELRNLFAHPETQAAFTIGLAASMLENTHRLVALVLGRVDSQ